jgi:hypothetical protein
MVHEAELRMAERLVEDGEGLVARQRDLIRRLSENGYPAEPAEGVLVRLEASLARRREYLRRVANPSCITTGARQSASQEQDGSAPSVPARIVRPKEKPAAPERGSLFATIRGTVGSCLAEALRLRPQLSARDHGADH